MAAEAAARRGGAGARGGRSGGTMSRARLPRWWWIVAAVPLALLVAGLLVFGYRSLDALYPQDLWRYFRPVAGVGSGSLLYRDVDGQLFLAPVADPAKGQRLADPSLPPGTKEVVRDALVLPDGKQVAYYATESREGQPKSDRLKVVAIGGGVVRNVAVAEPVREAVYASASGRYLALTSPDRTRVYYYDLSSDGSLTPGTADAAPERMLWTRNGDLRSAPLPGQPAFAAAPDGKLRAQVRAGTRRAPECGDEPRCEAVQELVIAPGAPAAADRPPVMLHGAFREFSAPGQEAQRLYGRLVWSPDASQVLFSALVHLNAQDGAQTRIYAVGTDGKTRPRLVLEQAEALDWIP